MTACLIVYYVIGAYVRYCRTLADLGLSDLDSPNNDFIFLHAGVGMLLVHHERGSKNL